MYMEHPGEILTHYAGELKTIGEDRIGGYLVVFSDAGSPDLAQDYFDRSTDFYGLEDGDKAITLWHHGMDPEMPGPIGKGTLKIDDRGVWYEAQLAARQGYEERVKDVMRLAGEGKLGLSSGSPGHLVRREKKGDSFHIKAWQIAEASITPTPCEPRTSVMPVKALVEDERMTLQAHTAKILASLDEYTARITDFVNMKRADDRKVSAERREAFKQIKAKLEGVIGLCEPGPDPEIAAMKLRLMREKLVQVHR